MQANKTMSKKFTFTVKANTVMKLLLKESEFKGHHQKEKEKNMFIFFLKAIIETNAKSI